MGKRLLFDFKADLGGSQGAFADDPKGSKGAFWGVELLPLSSTLILMSVPGTFRRFGPGIYLIDIAQRKASMEPWFRPEAVNLCMQSFSSRIGVDLCSLSSNRSGRKSTAAVATMHSYAAYWRVGTIEGGYVHTSDHAHSTALSPDGYALAVGCGKFVLDNVTSAEAVVELWSLSENIKEMPIEGPKRRLPGAVVSKLLWVKNDDGLLRSNIYNRLKIHDISEIILAVSIGRDQCTGYVTMLDPIFLDILDISDFRVAKLAPGIQAWPEESEPYFRVEGFGTRYFASFFELVCPDSDLDLLSAPLRTPQRDLLTSRLTASSEMSLSSDSEDGLTTIGIWQCNV